MNFSKTSQRLELTFPENGAWTNLLDEPAWSVEEADHRYALDIPSHWGVVFYQP